MATAGRRDRRFRQTFPGPNSADNQQMLQDIKDTLDSRGGQPSAKQQGPSEHRSATGNGERERERPESRDKEQSSSSRRSPPSEQPAANASPGTTPRMQQNRTPTKQHTDRTKQQLAKIRRQIRPYHAHSDPGFHAARDKVNQKMLEHLISLGYNETSSVSALVSCNSSSVDAALDVLQRESVKKSQLSSIQEDEIRTSVDDMRIDDKPDDTHSLTHKRSFKQNRRSPDKSAKMDTSCQYDPSDIGRISPISLPGFRTPVSFAELPPPPLAKDQPPYYHTVHIVTPRPKHSQTEAEVHSDSSPTRTSPPSIQSSPPPYFTTNSGSPEARTHVHVSPPPEVHPHSYSPFSAPFSYRKETPPAYDRSYKPSPAYRTSQFTPTAAELSDSGIEEEATPRRPSVPPEAFKFFMEQHIENIFKSYQQRMQRRIKLEQEMAKRDLDDSTSEQMRRILYQKESNFLRLKRAKLHKDMFEMVKPLGIGAFGVVSLVRKSDTGKLYAMKTLRKADVLRRNQVAHVKAERDILAEADNEWVVKLFFSFQDMENLFFVMEYIPGGDMMSLLIKLGTFPEHLALFYIAELVCAIESVHKMGFIHRDIKPDNILIGSDGHIKLTDFGLCTGFRWTHDSSRYQPKGGHHRRQGSMDPMWDQVCSCMDESPLKPLELRRVKEHNRCVAHSLVGTPNYISPEILRRNGYTQLCDWWSVGVIMYEMLVGQPPFMAPTPSETQLKIMNWSEYIHIPRHANMSQAAADMILRFICDPQDRIGRNGPEEIKRQPFFSAIDWRLGIRNYEPPYIPKILYDADTSNFDPIPQSQLQKLSKKQQEVASLPKGQPEHAFYEWTFIRFYPDKGSGKRPTLTPSSVHQSPPQPSHPPHPPPPFSSSPSSPSPASKDKKKAPPQPVYV